MKIVNLLRKLDQRGFDHILMAVAFVAVMAVIGAGYIVINGHSTVGVSHAATGSGDRILQPGGDNLYVNAWGGGPWVNGSTNKTTINDDFTILGKTGGNVYIVYTGQANRWNGKCIGDAYNSPTNYQASLDPCPNPGTGYTGGWGTNFKEEACGGKSGLWAFQNLHSKGYLNFEVPYPGNGSNFFVSSGNAACYKLSPV